MNWKALLPAAAFLVLWLPNAAFSRNHHFFGNQNGMINQFGNGGQFLGAAAHTPFNSGINPLAAAPLAAPMVNAAPFAASALAGNGLGFVGNNSLLGMNNGMGMMCGRRHHHKRKRRGLLNALLNQNSMYGNGYGYNSYGCGGGGLLGNSYGYGGYGGGGLGGGLRNILNRI